MMMMVNGNRGRGGYGKCKDNHINRMIKKDGRGRGGKCKCKDIHINMMIKTNIYNKKIL